MKRFWDKVAKIEGGCWLWTACIKTNGYGAFRFEGRSTQAHRVSYVLAKGPIPAGKEVDHMCEIRACVNPDHLKAVTHAENLAHRKPGKQVALRSHCVRGHLLIPENCYKDGRVCRACNRARGQSYRERKRHAILAA